MNRSVRRMIFPADPPLRAIREIAKWRGEASVSELGSCLGQRHQPVMAYALGRFGARSAYSLWKTIDSGIQSSKVYPSGSLIS